MCWKMIFPYCMPWKHVVKSFGNHQDTLEFWCICYQVRKVCTIKGPTLHEINISPLLFCCKSIAMGAWSFWVICQPIRSAMEALVWSQNGTKTVRMHSLSNHGSISARLVWAPRINQLQAASKGVQPTFVKFNQLSLIEENVLKQCEAWWLLPSKGQRRQSNFKLSPPSPATYPEHCTNHEKRQHSAFVKGSRGVLMRTANRCGWSFHFMFFHVVSSTEHIRRTYLFCCLLPSFLGEG